MRTLKHLFTALIMLLCSAAVSAQTFEVDGIAYNVTNAISKTVEVVSKSTKYTGNVVIPETVPFNSSYELKENFGNWTSTNHADGSTSEKSYTIDAKAGDVVAFDWTVSSENGCDNLIVTLDGAEVFRQSGSNSGSYSCAFETDGTHTLIVKYTKDGSVSNGSDQVSVSNISLHVLTDEKITAYSVTSIGSNAFAYCSGLTSIEIPSSVTSIGGHAFEYCSYLNEVHISDLVAWCKINFNSSYANPLYYARHLYLNGEKVTDLVIPEGITRINAYAFIRCSDIVSVVIPSSVTSIGSNAFDGCYSLRNVSSNAVIAPSLDYEAFPDDNYNIYLNYPEGSNYFSWFQSLSSYTSNCGAEGDGVYYTRDNDDNLYIWGNGRIASNALSWYSDLKTVYIDEGITEIHSEAFAYCYNLKEVYLPNSLTTIGRYAFADCPIDLCVIPTSVASIGESAFREWDTNLVFKTMTAPAMSDNDCYNVIIPQGAYGFDRHYAMTDEKGCYGANINGESVLFCYGNVSVSADYLAEYEKVYIYRGASVDFISGMPNVKEVVYRGSKPVDRDYDDYFSLPGSNAVFCEEDGEIELVAGCVATVIPEGVKAIRQQAFDGCFALREIAIPNSVNSIEWRAFAYCTGLTSFVLPAGVESFESSILEGCTALESISVAEGNPNYDSRDNCNAIIETSSNKLVFALLNSTIPSTVTAIGYSVFPFIDTDFTIPANIVSIDNGAFSNAINLYFVSDIPATISGYPFGKGAIYVPASAYETYCNADGWKDYSARIVTTEIADKNIEVEATEGMSGVLDDIGLEGVEKVVKLKVKGSINSYDIIVFREKMPLLSELDLSEATVVASTQPFYQTYCTGNNSLGAYAFYNLDKLKSVKLPLGLVNLGDYAFAGCDNLKTVDASAAGRMSVGSYTFNSSKLENVYLPNVVEDIGAYAFKGNQLDSLTFGTIVGDIAANAFNYCTKLQSVEVGVLEGNINSNAFYDCDALVDVNVGEMVGKLCDKAFNSCEKLQRLAFGKGPLEIGSRVLYSCENVKEFIAGEGLTTVGAYAFSDNANYNPQYNSNLERVVLPETVTTIGAGAFSSTNLRDFKIPSNVVSIGDKAFRYCDFETIEIPDSVATIASCAFEYCNALKSVKLPENLNSIESGAFKYCGNLTEVILPPALENISDNAFYGTGIREIRIPSSVKTIGNSAFAGCSKLNDVYTYTIEPTVITESTFSTFATAKLYVPATSFWNYYWDIGWSKFNQKNFVEFNEPYEYFYLNGDYVMNDDTGYIEVRTMRTPMPTLAPRQALRLRVSRATMRSPSRALAT